MNEALVSSLCCLDTNEDDVLDEQELEALFTKEVRNHFSSLNTTREDSSRCEGRLSLTSSPGILAKNLEG